MPELPEVETVVRSLRSHLEKRAIVGFTAHWPRVTAPASPEDFTRQVAGHTIRAVRRRGKYVLLDLDRGYVHLHLRMTGRLLVLRSGDPETSSQPHVTAEFDLSNPPGTPRRAYARGQGGRRLIFQDMRKFGRVGYLEDLAQLEARLGPEPLSSRFTPRFFHRLLQGRRRRIKPLLLDQSFIAGLGNIYVDEALFLARIHPETSASGLTFTQAQALHRAIQDILNDSIQHDGTTIINFQYGEGNTGRFREKLRVFRREEQPCPVCGTPLVKIRVAQRGTYLCPACQVP